MQSAKLSRRASLSHFHGAPAPLKQLQRRASTTHIESSLEPWNVSKLSPSQRRKRSDLLWKTTETILRLHGRILKMGWLYWQRYIALEKTSQLQELAMTIASKTQPGERNESQLGTLLNWLKLLHHPFLEKFADANDHEGMKIIAECLELKRYERNSILCWQTNAPERVFVILSGVVECWYNVSRANIAKRVEEHFDSTHDSIEICMKELVDKRQQMRFNLRRSGFFGVYLKSYKSGSVLGGFDNVLRQGTHSKYCENQFTAITSGTEDSDVVCLSFQRSLFNSRVVPRLSAHMFLKKRINFLSAHPLFENVSPVKVGALHQISLSMKGQTISKGDVVLQCYPGEPSDIVFLIEGNVEASIVVPPHPPVNRVRRKVKCAILRRGEVLGFPSKFSETDCQQIEFAAASSTCKLLRLNYREFLAFMMNQNDMKMLTVGKGIVRYVVKKLETWLSLAAKEYDVQVRTMGPAIVEHKAMMQSRWKQTADFASGDEVVEHLDKFFLENEGRKRPDRPTFLRAKTLKMQHSKQRDMQVFLRNLCSAKSSVMTDNRPRKPSLLPPIDPKQFMILQKPAGSFP